MMKKILRTILRAIPVVLVLVFCLSVTAMAYSGSESVTLKTTQNEATSGSLSCHHAKVSATNVKDYTGYVCINEIGDIIKPNYVSCGFPKLLEEHGLRRVRYHDLRHSCASLLLANGVPMKQIQEWLGHSDFSTTANIYAHLEYSSKVISADAMLAGLGIGNRE